MKIVFMGTPDFAVASLKALYEDGFEIAGVVTAPDKPAGRGQKMSSSAVKQFAAEHGLKVLQPEKLRDQAFLDELRALGADLQVIVAFRMLPEVVWNMPPKGTVNLHGSLLPQYRGAAPINWAIINGEKESGVSTFFLRQEIDTGNIIFTDRVEILPDDTAGDLHDKLMAKGAKLMLRTVRAIEHGDYPEHPQDLSAEIKTAPKIFKEDCRIDWDQPVRKVFDFIRGLSPYPTAFTFFQDKSLKIFAAELSEDRPAVPPGHYESDGKAFLRFACADGYLSVKEVQAEGKKRMPIADFLRGIRI